MRAALLFVSLLGFWILLSGVHSVPVLSHSPFPFLLFMGIFSSGLATALAVRMGIVDAEAFPFERIPAALRYIPWLYWQIVVSSIDVAKQVWSPRLRISPRVSTVPCDTRTTIGAITYANSITLTPGTVTIDLRDGEILIHSISVEAEGELQDGEMLRRVKVFEGAAR